MKKFKKICNNVGKQISKPFKQPQIIIRAVNEIIVKPIDKAIVKPIQKSIKKLQGNTSKIKCEQIRVSKIYEQNKYEEKIENLQKMDEKVQKQLVKQFSQINIHEKKEKKKGINVCLIGPASVGKKTLLNQMLDLNLSVGLSSCAQQAQCISTKNGITYWNAPEINKNFNFQSDIHLSFFNDMNVFYVLFDREVKDVSLIIKGIVQMKKQIIYVRTKCDNWNQTHKLSLAQQLQRDLQQIRQLDENCKEVIPSGYKMNQKVVKSFNSLKNSLM